MRALLGLGGGLVALLAIAGMLAFTAPASAQDWCGFQQKANARVRCGYSSLQECKEALTRKAKKKEKKSDAAVTCKPDPAFG